MLVTLICACSSKRRTIFVLQISMSVLLGVMIAMVMQHAPILSEASSVCVNKDLLEMVKAAKVGEGFPFGFRVSVISFTCINRCRISRQAWEIAHIRSVCPLVVQTATEKKVRTAMEPYSREKHSLVSILFSFVVGNVQT